MRRLEGALRSSFPFLLMGSQAELKLVRSGNIGEHLSWEHRDCLHERSQQGVGDFPIGLGAPCGRAELASRGRLTATQGPW